MAVLTIDIGNTRGKFAVISQEGVLVSFGYLENLDGGLGEIKQLCENSRVWEDPIKSIIYSSVKKVLFDWILWKLDALNPIEIKDLMFHLPFQVDIEQPETLGSDRLAGVMGCMYFLENRRTNGLRNVSGQIKQLHDRDFSYNTNTSGLDDELEEKSPKKAENDSNKFGVPDFMMIDAGTCVTYDYVKGGLLRIDNRNSMESGSIGIESRLDTSEAPVYFGGAISPGLRLRYKAMSDYTDALPLLDVGLEDSGRFEIGDIGKHTVEAMHSGVIVGFVDEISGRIDRFKEKFVDSQVFLTGGDADFLGKRLKSGIFVEPMLLHYGLFYADQFKR